MTCIENAEKLLIHKATRKTNIGTKNIICIQLLTVYQIIMGKIHTAQRYTLHVLK